MKPDKTTLKPAQPVMTMSDMARLAGVSESTVSRALADNPLISAETRARIQELARIAGYSVNPAASSLRTKQSKLIAVVIPLLHGQDQHLSDPFMMAMLAYLADSLTGRGYDLLLSKIDTHEDGWIERLARTRRAAGVIMVGQSLEHAAIERAVQAGVPLVVWGARLEDQSYATVGSDNRQGGYIATHHLVETGRRRIAFLGERRLPEIRQRFEGYLQALGEAGLPSDPALQIDCGFTAADAHQATRHLIASGASFDAIFACSDVIAMSAVHALNDAGRESPRDVAVVGFDGIEMAAFTVPPLTTVRQDLAQGARLLVDKIIAVAAGQPVESTEMPVQLVIRASSQPPR